MQDRIDEPVSEQAEEEARLTPAEAVSQMRIRVPPRANRKLGTLLERVNEDKQLKGWWHVANINAVKRLEINDHSWVHIQIVANIALKLLRQLTKHGVEPAVVRDYGKPLTLEAGIVRVADALDMAKGRSRIPFEHGRVSIHSLSAAAIEEVVITDGAKRPIMIEIHMNNSAGIYQVDGLLKAKLQNSGLERYVEVVARIDTEAEKRLVPIYRLEIGGGGAPPPPPPNHFAPFWGVFK